MFFLYFAMNWFTEVKTHTELVLAQAPLIVKRECDLPAEDFAAFLEQLCSGFSDLLNEYCLRGQETGQGRSRTGHIN